MNRKMYVLFDKEREEYVSSADRRLVSNTIEYKTSKNMTDAIVFGNVTDNPTATTEENIGLAKGTLEYQPATTAAIQAAKQRSAIREFKKAAELCANNDNEDHDMLKQMWKEFTKLVWEWYEVDLEVNINVEDLLRWATKDE